MPQRGVIVGYDTRFASPQRGAGRRRSYRGGGNSGEAGQRLHAHACSFLRGEKAWGGRRRDGHLQPQSLELEWREVQSQVRRLGDSRHHEVDRRRTGARSAAPKGKQGSDRRSRSQERLRRSVCEVRRFGPDREAKFKFAVDSMYGSGRGVLPGIFDEHGSAVRRDSAGSESAVPRD